MKSNSEAVVLRIYINSIDNSEQKNLYEFIVFEAKRFGIAGATVLRGIEGYEIDLNQHHTGILHKMSDMPVVVEIIDDEEKISSFCEAMKPVLSPLLDECFATLAKTRILLCKTGNVKTHQ